MYISRNAVKVIPKIWIYLYILCMYICWNAVKVIPKIWMYLYIIIMYVYMPDCSQSNSQNVDVFVYIMYLCMPDCSQSNSQNFDVFVYILCMYICRNAKLGCATAIVVRSKGPPTPQPHFPAPTFPPNSTVTGYAPELYSKHCLVVTLLLTVSTNGQR